MDKLQFLVLMYVNAVYLAVRKGNVTRLAATGTRASLPNFYQIGRTVAEYRDLTIFQNGDRPSSWIFEILNV